MAKQGITIKDLNQPARLELLRVIMNARFTDAMQSHIDAENGYNHRDVNKNTDSFKMSILNLFDAVAEDMENGKLTPFSGDYNKWLADRGFTEPLPTAEQIAALQRGILNNDQK